MRTIVITLLACAAALLPSARGARNALDQDQDAATRMRELLAPMNRKEHKVKEVLGVRMEKYREIRSEPVLKKNVREYAGAYKAPDRGYSLILTIGAGGQIQGGGSERSQAGGQPRARRFTLRNARIEGALLRATKVYADGGRETLEGVFITRTERSSPTDTGRSHFGLGMIGAPITVAGTTRRDKIFYAFSR